MPVTIMERLSEDKIAPFVRIFPLCPMKSDGK